MDRFFAFNVGEFLRPEFHGGAADESSFLNGVLAFQRQFFDSAQGSSALAQTLSHNFATYLPYDLHVKTDRMTMAHALEARSPFLDTALMEYVAGLPDHYKLRGRTTKYILRKTFAGMVPREIQSRGKMGFGMPLGTWFRGDLQPYVRDLLTSRQSRIAEYLQPRPVLRVIEDHVAGRGNHEHEIWLLITLELWLRNLSKLSRPWDEQLVVRPQHVVAPAA